jgi:ABC-type multidrug transport system permease subunit
MIALEKKWVRILISIFGSSLFIELIHISTGDPNREMKPNPLMFIFWALIIYGVMTYTLKKMGKIR